jgi:hypothetical protein
MLQQPKQRSWACYKALTNAISESAVCTDTSFIVKSWNKASEKIYELTEEHAIGKNLFTLTGFSVVNGSPEKILESIRDGGCWT